MRGLFKFVLSLGLLALGAFAAVELLQRSGTTLEIPLLNGFAASSPTASGTASATVAAPAALPAATAVAPAGGSQSPTVTVSAAPPTVTALQPTAIAAGTPGAVVEYTVQPGDNLTAIAARFDTTIEAIRLRNNIEDVNNIYAGITLQIVPGERVTAPAEPSVTAGAGGSTQPAATAVATDQPVATTTPAAAAGPAPTAAIAGGLEPVRPAGAPETYEAFIPTASKSGQFAKYTCEFDAAWVILKTYGFDVSLEQQIDAVGIDKSVVPAYRETAAGVEIRGGDIANAYSGDYNENFMARSTGNAMRKVFERYDLRVTPLRDRAGLEAALRAGELVWIKTTVDFKPWVAATWVGPDGRAYKTVLGNDHAVVVAGFNAAAVYIRDVLGPTSTNAARPLEYEVPWPTFLAAWGAQDFDGLAVARGG